MLSVICHDDILKIVVKDRYNDSPPAVGFIKGFGLRRGAFASSVAHDSHNIIAVGTSDSDIVNAINEVSTAKRRAFCFVRRQIQIHCSLILEV